MSYIKKTFTLNKFAKTVLLLSAVTSVQAGTMGKEAAGMWSGIYGGLNAGGIWGSSKFDWSQIAEGTSAFLPGTAAALPLAANARLESSGFLGGVQLGANHQANHFLFGVEADLDYAHLNTGRSATTQPIGGAVTVLVQENFSNDWLSTLRARLGYARNNWLLFGTTGIGITKVKYANSAVPSDLALLVAPSPLNSLDTGWAVGGGFEWKFAEKWSAKAEYLYLDFGNLSYTGLGKNLAGSVPFPNATIRFSHHLQENVARVGVNYFWG